MEMKSEIIIAKTISNSLSISGDWSEKKGSSLESRGVRLISDDDNEMSGIF